MLAKTSLPGAETGQRILFLDDDPVRARSFLDRHPAAVWVQTASECISRLQEEWCEVHLDHDLGGEIFVDSSREDCGMEVVRWLCARAEGRRPQTLFFIHSHNAEAATLMVRQLSAEGYRAVYRPFGIDVLDRTYTDDGDTTHSPGGPGIAGERSGMTSSGAGTRMRSWLSRWLDWRQV